MGAVLTLLFRRSSTYVNMNLLILSTLVCILVSATQAENTTETSVDSENSVDSEYSADTYSCPEYFKHHSGGDIDYINNVQTWQECGKLCKDHAYCTSWSWDHPGSNYIPYRCWLHNGTPHFTDSCVAYSGT